MARNARFLPFVTETTHISVILDKLRKSSQGVPPDIMLSIANIVLTKGIEYTRANLAKYEGLENWNARYIAIIEENKELQIPQGTTALLDQLSVLMTLEDFEEVKDSKLHDLYILYLMAIAVEPETKEERFYNLRYINNAKDRVNSFPAYALFHDDGPLYYVRSKRELIAYIFYKIYIKKVDTPFPPVKLVFGEAPPTSSTVPEWEAPKIPLTDAPKSTLTDKAVTSKSSGIGYGKIIVDDIPSASSVTHTVPEWYKTPKTGIPEGELITTWTAESSASEEDPDATF